VLEGEKALRSEAARQLREVERRLAALKNPQWWGGTAGTEASKFGEEALLKKRARLAAAAESHGRQIQEVQLALVQSRCREEERGGGAADNRRWASLPAPPEVHAVLTTVFRSASQYKAQSYEAQLALTELSEEVEMLLLRLEVAEAERLEAAMRAESSQQAQQHIEREGNSYHPVIKADPTDAEAANVLEQLNSLSGEGAASKGGRGAAGIEVDGEDSQEEEEEEDDWDESEEEEEDDDDDEEEDSWDPSHATPHGGKSRRHNKRRGSASTTTKDIPEQEVAVLAHLNTGRAAAGKDALKKLTVAEMRASLKGKVIFGQQWKAGNKNREDLVADYLQMVTEEASGGQGQSPPGVAPHEELGDCHVPESPVSAGRGTRPFSSSNGRKSPFGQIANAFRKANNSQSASSDRGELKSPSRSGSLMSFAARALGSSRMSSGSADAIFPEIGELPKRDDVIDRGDQCAGSENGGEATYDVSKPEPRNSSDEQVGGGEDLKSFADGAARRTTSSGSATSAASVKSAGSKRSGKPAWIPG